MAKYTIILLCIFGVISSVYSAANCGADGKSPCPLRCQNETAAQGGFLEIATICEDEMDGCPLLFNCSNDAATCDTVPASSFDPSKPETNPKVRAAACDDPSVADIALKCAKTCGICCETPAYACDDDEDGGIDCIANKAKCKDDNWVDIMATYCPKTCGLCNVQISGGCSDKNTGCQGIASLCKNIDFIDYMRGHCQRTCNLCPNTNTNGTCYGDVATNCAEHRDLCTNDLYRPIMAQQCCTTCANATGNTSGGTFCTDSNPSCPNWVANGFCASTFYTPEQKRQYCSKSCNLCV